MNIQKMAEEIWVGADYGLHMVHICLPFTGVNSGSLRVAANKAGGALE